MISADRMAVVDLNTEALGVPRQQLMESSGHAIARCAKDMVDPGDRITIVAGRGNNGGDGFVAARFLSEYDIQVQLLGRPDTITTDIARANWDILETAAIECDVIADSTSVHIPPCDLIIDALLGTGVRGKPREPIASAMSAINDAAVPVLAVDVPSGMDADSHAVSQTVVDPTQVVTFHDIKPALTDIDVPVTVADIGIPDAAEDIVGPGDLTALTRNPDSHKGDAGRILVVGGGPYTGAPALSAQAAMRAGADLGIIVCPAGVGDTIQGYTPDLIVHTVSGDTLSVDAVSDICAHAETADCVVIGPGLGSADETLRTVREFLREFDGRCVVDADALAVVPDVDTDAQLICTPHRGELATMGGPTRDSDDSWREAISAFADALGHTLLVKGQHDVISDGERSRISRTGNPGMTVGGTGDVLAGVVASFAAQLEDPLTAAALGAYVNGVAGDFAANEYGDGLLASDVLEHIPAAIAGDFDDR